MTNVRMFSVPPLFGQGAPEYAIPTYSGADARLALVRAWGLPNAWPRPGEGVFSHSRVLFVDDHDQAQPGRPVAFWIPPRLPLRVVPRYLDRGRRRP